MSDKKLGKGLSALLGDTSILDEIRKQEIVSKSSFETKTDFKSISNIDISLIEADPKNKQPRRTFNDNTIDELSQSIKEKGVLQPIFLRKKIDSTGYYLISGERRWRASKSIGLKTIPAILFEAKDVEAWEIGIIENLQREDLNAIDEAYAFNHLIEKYNYTKNTLAKKLSKSLSYISNSLSLIKLSKKIKNQLRDGLLTQGHARPLLRLESEDSEKVAENIIKQSLSVRETEALIRDILTGEILIDNLNKDISENNVISDSSNNKSPEQKTSENNFQKDFKEDFKYIEDNISEYLKTQVKLNFSKRTKKPSGRLEIKFKDINHLEEIIKFMNASSK